MNDSVSHTNIAAYLYLFDSRTEFVISRENVFSYITKLHQRHRSVLMKNNFVYFALHNSSERL